MAKKNHKGYLNKISGTVAATVAMTMALSAQVNAAELEEDVLPVDGSTDLQNLRICKQIAQPSVHADLVYSEKEGLLWTGQLQKGDTVSWLVLGKAWTGLGIKADYLL